MATKQQINKFSASWDGVLKQAGMRIFHCGLVISVCFVIVNLAKFFLIQLDHDDSSLELKFPIIDGLDTKVLTRAQKKNMKKKQKKKESKQPDYAFEIEEVIGPMEEMKVSEVDSETTVLPPPSEEPGVKEVGISECSIDEIKKKIRTLKKKLKQIEELEEKVSQGDINPNKEQINKLSKKEAFLEEIQSLTAIL